MANAQMTDGPESIQSPRRLDEMPSDKGADRSTRRLIGRVVRAPQFGPLIAAGLLYVFFAIASWGNGFVSVDGTASWLNTASELGIVAVPVGLLMIAGEFDLSIGSVVGASSITMGIVNGYYHDSLFVGVAVALVIAVAVGCMNGVLVTRTELPSFIVTLGANLLLAGLSLTIPNAIMGNTTVALTPSGLGEKVFAGQAGQFYVSILWWLAIAVAGGWCLAKTRWGNWIFATGGSEENARRAGVPTRGLKIGLFLSTSIAAALVGIIQSIQYSTGDGTTGQGYVFEAAIVVVIGGVLLGGGFGTISGVAIATVLYGFVSAGLFYTGWDPNYAQVVIGVMMVIAVLTNNFVRSTALRTVRSTRGGD